MDPDTLISLAIIALGALTTSTIGFAVAWFRARDRAIKAEARLVSLTPGSANLLDGGLAARLDQVDQALDAIAVEVERVGEAERFQTKLLAQRGGTPERSPAPGRVITPH